MAKGLGEGWMSVGIQMSPANVSGYEVCKWRSKGCSEVCLFNSGYGFYPKVKESRKKKTRMFFEMPELFKAQMQIELNQLLEKTAKLGLKLAIRLNVLSDIEWENEIIRDNKTIFQLYPTIQFYDYTKSIHRVLNNTVPNYDLTYSRSETKISHLNSLLALKSGKNVAIVFNVKKTKPLPDSYLNFEVIDGDKTDLRFLDKKGVVVGLRTKGNAHGDKTGFVVSV